MSLTLGTALSHLVHLLTLLYLKFQILMPFSFCFYHLQSHNFLPLVGAMCPVHYKTRENGEVPPVYSIVLEEMTRKAYEHSSNGGVLSMVTSESCLLIFNWIV